MCDLMISWLGDVHALVYPDYKGDEDDNVRVCMLAGTALSASTVYVVHHHTIFCFHYCKLFINIIYKNT